MRLLPVLSITAVLAFPSTPLHAQQAAAGGSYTLLSLSYPDQIPNGFGGWLTWDAAPRGLALGADLGVNVFPEHHPVIGRQTQLQAGIRFGARTERLGGFARVRPGLVHFSERFFAPDTICILIFPPPESCLIAATNATLDLGGTAEVYVTPKSLIRLDLGDTLIRFGRSGQDPVWRHNLQFAAGVGLRF